MDIYYAVFVYNDPENTGWATYIHPTSGYVWVELDSGPGDFMSPADVRTVNTGDEYRFRDALRKVEIQR
ncbi:hypothetical protein PBI_REDNO2_203 [Mycobacterium phage Redno2]|uniref:hypothetical protein n=1 Tax=Mycobacterium phage Redno2 TaxID=1340709 RepID=UPI000387AA33|nr:hypothetical protein N860_gp205 [Mycobacterium phage Redno2]AGS82501.1 hypothetical protein PBI_REDNO2_203 [Mycobacterium phage Redno2]QZD98083.1 hypothetical protein SEA_BEEM_213 [Mycobacterium phage Beem]UEM46689.1 hypothetical protein SEA_JUICYJAY_206 [Mycobacterium phage JuicyJay]